MHIGKQAKWGMHKKYDEDREIVVAVGENGVKAFYIKCKARDFKKNEESQDNDTP